MVLLLGAAIALLVIALKTRSGPRGELRSESLLAPTTITPPTPALPLADPDRTSLVLPTSEPQNDVSTENGRVAILEYFSRAPVKDLTLQLASLTNNSRGLALVTDALGEVVVPPGRYIVAAPGPQVLLGSSVDVVGGETTLVLSTRRCQLEVAVLTTAGQPIEGATVLWEAIPGVSSMGMTVSETAITDRMGLASFPNWVETCGTLGTAAEGFAWNERDIQGPVDSRVVILMRPGGVLGTLCVTDIFGSPLSGATVGTRLGRIGPSKQNGLISWPSWIPTNEEFGVVEADGFVGKRILLEERADCVQLARSGTIVVSILNAQANVPVWIDCSARQPHDTENVLPKMMPISSADLKATIELPVDVPISVTAFDHHGNVGIESVRLSAGSPTTVLEIELQQASLQVQCETSPGNPIQCEAIVHYSDERPPLRLIGREGVGIPSPEHVSRIILSSTEHETVELRPIRSAASSSQGTEGFVRALLQPASKLRVHVIAPGEAGPLAGMSIRAMPRATAIREYPQLFGGWPTNHPGWALHRGTHRIGTTRADGSWTVTLAHGDYRLQVDIPPEFGGSHSATSLYTSQSRVIFFHGQEDVTIVAPRPVFLSFDVYEETTRLPVESVQVGAGVVPEPLRRGNHWEGWLEEGARELSVLAPGVGSTRINLPLESREILVRPENAASILVADAPAELRGREVAVQLYEQWGRDRIGFATTRIRLGDDGRARLFLPYLEVRGFSIQGTDAFDFVPEYCEWEPGHIYVFQIIRK